MPGNPPAINAAVVEPAPAVSHLAVFKSASSDHVEPLYSSFITDPSGSPPTKAQAVCVPYPEPPECLAVLKSPDSVHDEPSYSSVIAVPLG